MDDNGTPGNAADDFNATFVSGDTSANGLLDTTETWTFTATRIATAGQYSNLATAKGTPPPGGGSDVTDTNPDHHFGAAPAINLVKRTNGTDNNAAPGPSVSIGSTVTFTYAVTNPGNVPLSGVTVRDDDGTPGNLADDFNAAFVGGDTNANGLLDTTETWTFTASRMATAGQYTNVGTAAGTPPPGGGAAVTDTDVDNHFGTSVDGGGGTTPRRRPCDGVPVSGYSDRAAAGVHAGSVDCVTAHGLAHGFPDNTFRPQLSVSRAQMATLVAGLVRGAGVALPPSAPDAFPGDDGGVHERAIDQLAALGVWDSTTGQVGNRFDVAASMRRDDMAQVLSNAYRVITGQSLAPGANAFDDDAGNDNEAAINALAQRGVVHGTGPRAYSPAGAVSRAQFATFLANELQILADAGVQVSA
jgi:hypothetical protein